MSSKAHEITGTLVQLGLMQADGHGGVEPAGAQLSVDGNGNTVLVGADGEAFDRFPLPLNPNGLDWLTDTISGFDIYERGFVRRPTLFFDPTASGSFGYGTFKQPFSTQAQLQAFFNKNAGNISGTKLGIKRGTKLITTGNGLELFVYASDTDPVYIIPYGDAEALPIISGEEVLSGWAVYSGTRGQSGCIYSHAYTKGIVNAYYNTRRLSQKSSIAGIVAAGQASWVSNVLYVRLHDDADPDAVGSALVVGGWSDTTWVAKNLITVFAPQKASSGSVKGHNIVIAGLDMQYAQNNAIRTGYDGLYTSGYAAAAATIDVLGTVTIAGVRYQHCGTDGGSGNMSGVTFQGLNNSVRGHGNLVGCRGYDIINNMMETNSTDGGEYGMQFCQGELTGGASIMELWVSSSNWKCRYNIGKWATNTGNLSTGYAAAGAWQSDKTCQVSDGQPVLLTNDTDFSNNEISHNLIVNTTRAFFWRSGSDCKVMNNTVIIDSSLTPPGNTSISSAGGQFINCQLDFTNTLRNSSTNIPPAGWVTFSNNLFVSKGYDVNFTMGYFDTERPPLGDDNMFLADSAGRFWQQTHGASSVAINSQALLNSSLGANFAPVNASAVVTGGTLTFATEFGKLDSANNYAPTAGSALIDTGTAITTIGNQDLMGRPYSSTTPNIGCNE